MNDTSILIIYTGGTIGMFKDSETGVLRPFDFDNLYSYIPVLKDFKVVHAALGNDAGFVGAISLAAEMFQKSN
jgi:L-asparaginase